jgi:hypothetical protein
MIDVFEAVTLPSLVRQTDREFRWLIVIDAAMPSTARHRLEDFPFFALRRARAEV